MVRPLISRQIRVSPGQRALSDRLLQMSDEEAAAPTVEPITKTSRSFLSPRGGVCPGITKRLLSTPLPEDVDLGRFSEQPPWTVPSLQTKKG
jgi:hypothetical protein